MLRSFGNGAMTRRAGSSLGPSQPLGTMARIMAARFATSTSIKKEGEPNKEEDPLAKAEPGPQALRERMEDMLDSTMTTPINPRGMASGIETSNWQARKRTGDIEGKVAEEASYNFKVEAEGRMVESPLASKGFPSSVETSGVREDQDRGMYVEPGTRHTLRGTEDNFNKDPGVSIEQVEEKIRLTTDKVAGGAKHLAGTVKHKAQDLTETAKETVHSINESAKSGMHSAAQETVHAAREKAHNLSEAAKSTMHSAQSKAHDMAESAKSTVQSMTESVKHTMHSVNEKGQEMMDEGPMKTAKDTLQSAQESMHSAKDRAKEMMSDQSERAKETMESAKESMHSAKDTAKEMMSDQSERAKETMESAKESMHSAKDKAKEMMSDESEGMRQSVKSTMESAKETAKGMANEVEKKGLIQTAKETMRSAKEKVREVIIGERSDDKPDEKSAEVRSKKQQGLQRQSSSG